MPRKYKSKKEKKALFLIVTLLLFLSLPIMAYSLLERNLDTRSKAFDRLELSDNNPCIISLPNVNPYSLEVGKSVRIQIDAKYTNAGIQKLLIMDSSGAEIYSEEFPESPLQIGTSFTFTPTKSGVIDLLGSIEKTGGGSAACKISSPFDIKGIRAIENNSSPEFTTQPSSSKPGQDIKTGVQYEYNLIAEDDDKDRINYFYSFTPRADWLKAVIVEDGSNGKLSLTFRGTSDKPASYLAHVVIHDGYSMHVRTQSWVISVSPAENDIPIIRIVDPLSATRVDSGDPINTSWNVSDLNHVSKFQLFMAKNPSNESSWIKIGEDLAYNVSKATVDTKDLSSGTYKFIVKATDNQNPPKSGIGVSPEIVISKLSDKDNVADDEIVLPEAQVINMSPNSEDLISNSRVTVKGTIIASEDASVNEASIKFKIDDKDVTKDIKINKISSKEYTLIYQPSEDLEDGTHKAEISFSDTKDQEVKKSWEFTINSNAADNSEVYIIFGKEISKRTMLIIGMGLLLIIFAICIPLLISLIWGTNKKEPVSTVYTSRNVPSSNEFDNQVYIPPSVDVDIKEKVDDINTEFESNDSTLYSVGKYEEEKEEEEQDERIKTEENIIKEDPIFVPEKDAQTALVDEALIKPEPIAETNVEEEPVFKPTVYKEEKPIEEQIPPQPEDTNQAFAINQAPITPLEEPEAPDPSIFEQIANQIEAQTSEESNTTDSETNQ